MPAPRVTRKSIVNFVGVLALAASPFWLYALLFPEGYAYVAGIFVLFAALLVNIALIIHVSRQDAELRHIMLVGLFVKLMGAAAYLTVMLHYYHGGDMFGYFQWGSEIARNIREYGEIGALRGEFSFNANSAWNGSIVLIVITGGLFSIIGPSLAGAIVVFSSFAYWGSYFFWKAFARAFPQSDRYLAATLLFFMPSLVFWSATLGKDALMYFFIGLVTYGLCQALYGARSRAILLIAVGVFGVAVIRAHIASILALTLSVVFLISKNRSGMGGVLSRIALIPLLVVGSLYTTNSAKEKLGITETQSAQQVATN